MKSVSNLLYPVCLLAIFGLNGCSGSSPLLHHQHNQIIYQAGQDNDDDDAKDTPLKLVGERLFRETRFSQYFYAHSAGILNKVPAQGDSVVDTLDTITAQLAGPYKGQSMACAACHFVDQVKDLDGAGNRAYTDFSRRSRVPSREDGQTLTPRNSPNMVGSTMSDDFFLHHDGEFATPEDLIRASYTGRNMGWLPREEATAIHHIVEVIRNDDGTFPTETDLGGLSYRDLFLGVPTIPAKFLIPLEYRMEIKGASDKEIFDGLVKLVTGYLHALDFMKDEQGHYKGSPYDLFLRKNGLPLAPDQDESALVYSQRLLSLVGQLKNPRFITPADKKFKLHKQDFVFGQKELDGFKVFAGSGRCVQCHAAPDFTDHLFHNTGASQDEFDKVHGLGKFMALEIPTLKKRSENPDLYLPATDNHPKALGVFRAIPVADQPLKSDLGVWNIFANPDYPLPQAKMRPALCKSFQLDCSKISDEDLLQKAIGAVKTPTLRDLGQSNPYLHTGQSDRLEDVMDFYVRYSKMAREDKVRNADPRLKEIKVSPDDSEALTKFLQSLNEDYD